MSADRIRELNDAFRRSLTGGRVVCTRGVAALAPEELAALLDQVRGFDAFTADNDPHREHDFGAVELGGVRYFWKIDLSQGAGWATRDNSRPDNHVGRGMVASFRPRGDVGPLLKSRVCSLRLMRCGVVGNAPALSIKWRALF